MKLKLILAYLFCGTRMVAAQTDLSMRSHFMKDTSQNFLISLSGNYFFSSNVITNEFASYYYRGKFLTDDVKDGVSENLTSDNHYAGEANWDASIMFHPDTSNRNVEAFLSYRSRLHSGSSFTSDFFNLFFRGNKMFAGKTANLSDFAFQQYSYRQIVFGISNRFSLSENKKLYVGADLAINQGLKFLKVNTGSATLYTDPGGEFIDADLHATILTDDSAAQHPSSLDGSGYSGDLFIELETENSLYSLSVENFGIIHWNKWSTKVSLDSTFHFEGIDVTDIFEIGDSIRLTDLALDSAFYTNYVRNKSEQSVKTRLPMKISGSYTLFLKNSKVSTTFGIDVLLNTYSSIRYFGCINYKINRANHLRVLLASGGYTPFQAGLGFIHLFPWRMKLEVGSNSVYPMITYNSGKSQGAYLSLSKSF